MNTDRFSGFGEIILAAILWSLVGIIVKQIHGMSAQSIIFYRVGFAFIIFFAALLVTGNLKIIKLHEKKSYIILFAVLQVATMVCYFISILNASVSIAVLLLSIVGIMLIVDPGKLDFKLSSIGILAGIASGIFYAFQVMTSKYASST